MKHVSAIHPNISWVLPCGNGSCQISRRPGCSCCSPKLVLIAIVTVSLSIITVLGNFLVMLSIKVNRQLQTINNYFLFSLACADLTIGLLSMNLYSLYILMGYWPLGAVVCDLWLALDYTISNASVMNLLIISFDRYFCLTRPLTYPARRTTRLARLLITAAWVLSFLLWAPTILLWQSFVGKRIVPDGECYIQLLSSPVVTLVTTLPSFYLPAVIMIVLYTCISLTSRSRVAELQSGGETSGTSSGPAKRSFLKMRWGPSSEPDFSERQNEVDSAEADSIGPEQTGNSLHPKIPGNPPTAPEIPSTAPLPEITDPRWAVLQQNTSECSNATEVILNGSPTLACAANDSLNVSPGFNDCQAKRRTRVIARERKVTRIIVAILLTFIVTWTPYNVMAIVGTFCHVCVPGSVWTVGYWLCYINSTINPVCYALCNVTFRNTFRKLLRCRCKNLERK